MIYLPTPPSTARLKSFWLVISFYFSVAVAYPLSKLLPLHGLLMVFMITIIIAIPGICKPNIALLPYRVYNKICRIFSAYAKELLLFICFCILSVAMGQKMRALFDRHILAEKSWWLQRKMGQKKTYPTDEAVVLDMKPQGLSANFSQWAMEAGHWWTLLLLPFLALISAFEQEQPTNTVPENIYTLY